MSWPGEEGESILCRGSSRSAGALGTLFSLVLLQVMRKMRLVRKAGLDNCHSKKTALDAKDDREPSKDLSVEEFLDLVADMAC